MAFEKTVSRIKARKRLNMAIDATINEIEKIIKKDLPKLYEELNDIGLSVISEWYADYDPPTFYRRTGNLKNAFKVTINAKQILVDYKPEYLDDVYNQSPEIIFNNAFIGGYHGGSRGMIDPNETDVYKQAGHAIPMWRTPFPEFSFWYEPAVRSFSPMQKIDQLAQKAIDHSLENINGRIGKHMSVIRKYYREINRR